MYLDGSNAENNISLLVILCIIMYVKKKKKNIKTDIFFFTKPITDYGKMLQYREKYRSITNLVDVKIVLLHILILSF